ncbi:MAG: MetQ/NlpA family ABC transporter substrate-binding protein [Anaerolineales bacterium]|nr:MetQ/NlpA family ABC transporter substrate-binding protein [Anaerolineales bacterium]MDW8161580.1 MetQ/NlpA family ABC transporter substrate-binding protein [Anaerolineales bacterium]
MRIYSTLAQLLVLFILIPACAPQSTGQPPAAAETGQVAIPVLSGEGQAPGEPYPAPAEVFQPTPAADQPYPAPGSPVVPPASSSGAYPAPGETALPVHGGGERLRIAILPVVDSLPMVVAQREGLFAKYGVQVELIPVASAAERDQVITAGQADGMINDLISTLLYNKEGIQVQVVRLARVATPTSAQYHLVVSAASGIDEVSQLKGVPIGISQGTIIEYITDRLLEREGFRAQEIQKIAVPKIPDRLALLSSGELKAATLPDPFSYLAVQQGGRFLLQDSKYPEYGHSTYAFRKAVIDRKPQAVRAFLAAIEEAVARIALSPDQYVGVLVEEKLIPAPLEGSYQVPPFPPKGIPDEWLWNDVLAWATAKGIVATAVSYADSVTSALLP